LRLVNSTVSGNTASVEGGGIRNFNVNSRLEITNGTIAHNFRGGILTFSNSGNTATTTLSSPTTR
jgi:hypothetical protein